MRRIFDGLVCGIVGIVLFFAARNALPPNDHVADNVATKSGEPLPMLLRIAASDSFAGWKVSDYGLFKVATSRIMKVTYVAVPDGRGWQLLEAH